MASELCMNCFSVKGQYEVCPFCGYAEGTPPGQPHYLTPGTILGSHFIVGTVIGFGGFGIIYKCFDTTLGVTVAVKEFYPTGLVNRSPGESMVGLLSGDKQEQYRELLKRFLMEAQSVAQFGKAKDIVNVYDFFEQNGTAYIIMEYIDGVLLKDYLDKQGPMPPDAALSVIMLITEAVKKIHSKGIIHRDISPDNIFIASESSIKIFDFGAARLNDSEEGMAGETVIKVGYSAPEQYRDKARQGFFTDIYSVGAILYQMLTGVKPLESTEREHKDKLRSPLQLGVKINSNVDRAVMEAMAVLPELRFQGIREFEDALQSKRAAEYPQEKLRKRRRRRNWIICLAVSLVLAVGVGIGLYSTVLKPENRIFDTVVKEDSITVWVENEDQKKQMEALVEDGFKKGNSSSADEKVRRMQTEDEKVTVNVVVQKDMEAALKKAGEDEKKAMPNMFLTDHVADLSPYDLVSMRDNVYASLNVSDYLFLSEYGEQFSSMEEMPTGIDTLLLYAYSFDYDKNNSLDSSVYHDGAETVSGDTVSLEHLISSEQKTYIDKDTKFLRADLAVFSPEARVNALLLDHANWKKVFEARENPDQDMRSALVQIQKFNQTAYSGKFRINKNRKTSLYGSNMVAGVAYRKRVNEAVNEDSGKASDKGANPLSSYKTYVVTKDNRMLVTLSERYAITAESSENQKTACMRLLWVMLGEAGQEKKNAPDETTYPILRSVFQEFPSYNANYSGFINLVKKQYQCVLVGDLTGKIHRFSEGLQNETDDARLQDYCEAFVSGK